MVGVEDDLTLDELADRLGVHYMTAYRYLRTGRITAERRGNRWWVPADEVQRLTAPSRPARVAPASSPPGGRPAAGRTTSRASDGSERLFNRLVAGDGPGSWAVIEAALSGRSPTEVYLQVLAPALRMIGDGWAAGRLSVGLEHRATAVAMRIVGRMSPLFARPGRNRPGTVILAGAPGDPHVLPLAMVADVVRGAGFPVLDLGADVPRRSLLEAASGSNEEKRAIGVSVSADQHLAATTRLISAVRRAQPDVLILVGGPAIPDPERALELGADDWAADAAGVVTRLTAREQGGRVVEP